MFKSKSVKFIGTYLAISFAALVLGSCAGPASPSQPDRMLPAVSVAPNVVAPVGKMDYLGANFIPGEKVKVVFLIDLNPNARPIETVVAEGAQSLQVDANGCFNIKQAGAPEKEGVWPVRVYDEKGNVIATSLFVVKKPPEVKK